MSLHEDLKAFLDGELEPTRAEEVKAALERDPGLRRELAELKSLSATIQISVAEVIPSGLEKTLAALEKRQPTRQALPLSWLWTGGIAITAVLMVVVVLPMFSHSASDSASTVSAGAVAMESKADASAKAVPALPPVEMRSSTTFSDRAKTAAPLVDSERTPKVQAPVDRTRKAKVMSGHVDASKVVAVKPEASVSTIVASNEPMAAKKTQMFKRPPSEAAPAPTTNLGVSRGLTSPTVVTLSFASTETGANEVMALVGKYQSHPPEITSTFTKRGAEGKAAAADSSGNDGNRTIALDVPEEIADKLIADLKELPTDTPSGGGGAFGGGRASFASGGFAAGNRAGGSTGATGASSSRNGDENSQTIGRRGSSAARGRPYSERSSSQTRAGFGGAPAGRAGPVDSIKGTAAAGARSGQNSPPSGVVKQDDRAGKSADILSLSTAQHLEHKRSLAADKAIAPKTRHIIIVIAEKPKQQPVP